SPESATLTPKRPRPSSPPPVSLPPCCASGPTVCAIALARLRGAGPGCGLAPAAGSTLVARRAEQHRAPSRATFTPLHRSRAVERDATPGRGAELPPLARQLGALLPLRPRARVQVALAGGEVEPVECDAGGDARAAVRGELARREGR